MLMFVNRGIWRYQTLLSVLSLVIVISIWFWFHAYQAGYYTPGDLGDSRETAYYLEYLYRWLIGLEDSFTDVPIFYPLKHTLFLGAQPFPDVPVYAFIRLMGADDVTAYTLWYITVYGLNCLAAAWCLHRLGFSTFPVIVGALIYAYSIPITATGFHPAYLSRYGAPLAFGCLYGFWQTGGLRSLALCLFWTMIQLASGIYMGFYTFLLLGGFILVHEVSFFNRFLQRDSKEDHRSIYVRVVQSWRLSTAAQRSVSLVIMALALMIFLWLFVNYAKANAMSGYYGMPNYLNAPAIIHYLSSGNSWWGRVFPLHNWLGQVESYIYVLFIGLVPAILLILGIWYPTKPYRSLRCHIGLALLVLVLFTLRYYTINFDLPELNHTVSIALTPYLPFYLLPGFNAIQHMERALQIFLLFVGILAAVGVERLRSHLPKRFFCNGVCIGIVVLMLVEMASNAIYVTPRYFWQRGVVELEKKLPKKYDPDSIFFFATRHIFDQKKKITGTSQWLDMMYLQRKHGFKMINGFHARGIPGLRQGEDCADVVRGIKAILEVQKRYNDSNYLAMMRRVKPIGFKNCKREWWKKNPKEIVPQKTDLEKTISIVRGWLAR